MLARGAERVYAAARSPETITASDPRVSPLYLDLLDEKSTTDAAAIAQDVTLLVNNAGIATGANLLTDDLDDVRRELEGPRTRPRSPRHPRPWSRRAGPRTTGCASPPTGTSWPPSRTMPRPRARRCPSSATAEFPHGPVAHRLVPRHGCRQGRHRGDCAAVPVVAYEDVRVGDPVEFAGVPFKVSQITERAVRLTRTSA
ncbi:hypothetical protein GCM10010294_46030 [Streptomyces griseoloalbus]|nr:hypothetical protein GCM10010294_46030 [Streptomyces griseoloalbus]